MRSFRRGAAAGLASDSLADLQSYVVIERAGVRLLVGDTQLRQRLEDYVGFDFELTGQLIDANFTHTMTFRASQHLTARTDFHEISASPFSEPGAAAGTSVFSIVSDSFSAASISDA